MEKDSKDVSHEDFLDKAQTSYSEFELPSGLFADGKLHNKITIREMTGAEEDILASGKDNSMLSVIERCVTSLGDFSQSDKNWRNVLKSLPYTDHLFMLLRIRTVSLGREMVFQVKCPSCGKSSNQAVDLYDFKIEGVKDPQEKDRLVELSGVNVLLHPATIEDEDNWKKIKDPLSREILMRLTSLDGNQPTLDMVKKLSLRNRRKLSSIIREMEGDIDNKLEVSCPHCSEEFASEIPIWDRNFFFPSEI